MKWHSSGEPTKGYKANAKETNGKQSAELLEAKTYSYSDCVSHGSIMISVYHFFSMNFYEVLLFLTLIVAGSQGEFNILF